MGLSPSFRLPCVRAQQPSTRNTPVVGAKTALEAPTEGPELTRPGSPPPLR